jgi:hypothetical protein
VVHQIYIHRQSQVIQTDHLSDAALRFEAAMDAAVTELQGMFGMKDPTHVPWLHLYPQTVN